MIRLQQYESTRWNILQNVLLIDDIIRTCKPKVYIILAPPRSCSSSNLSTVPPSTPPNCNSTISPFNAEEVKNGNAEVLMLLSAVYLMNVCLRYIIVSWQYDVRVFTLGTCHRRINRYCVVVKSFECLYRTYMMSTGKRGNKPILEII